MENKYFEAIGTSPFNNAMQVLKDDQFKQGNVYHYTQKESLLSILNSNTLRFSNINKLNDPLEISFGLDVICNILKRKGGCDEIISFMNEQVRNAFVEIPTFVFSTSAEEDSHLQWINYADRGKGLSIKIHRRKFFDLIIKQNNNPANPPSIIELPVGFPCSEDKLFYKAKKVDESFFQETKRDKYISDSIKEMYEIENQSGLPVKLDDMTFYINANAAVRYHKKNSKPRNILSVLRNMGTTEKTKTYLREIGAPYDYPKPVELIKYIIKLGCEDRKGIILDFFAGSATVAEAVKKLNLEDSGDRKYILIQLPEYCDAKSEAFKIGFKRLTDVGKARIQATSNQIKEQNALYGGDLGFKVFKLDSSNIKTWDADFDSLDESLLNGMVENIKDDRSEEDVLHEILIKYGLDLTLPITEHVIADKKVFDIGKGALIISLSDSITLDVVEGIVKLKDELNPEIMRVVFKDSGFKDDVVKTNAVQILKQAGIEDVRSL